VLFFLIIPLGFVMATNACYPSPPMSTFVEIAEVHLALTVALSVLGCQSAVIYAAQQAFDLSPKYYEVLCSALPSSGLAPYLSKSEDSKEVPSVQVSESAECLSPEARCVHH